MTFICEVTNKLQYGTVALANVIHVSKTSGDEATLSEVNAMVVQMARLYTFTTSLMPSGYAWTAGAKVMQFEDSTSSVRTFVPATPVNASTTSGTGKLPSQCAVCINWVTGIPGRSKRGRTFLGPLAASAIGTDGTLGSNTAVALTGATALRTGLAGLTPSWYVTIWSKKLHTSAAVTAATTDGLIDTLRSRKY